jgi:hypothetical protein
MTKILKQQEKCKSEIYAILVDSNGFWRWCITRRINGFVDFVHRPEF